MTFLKNAHSLIFKMMKNAGKSWKILFTLIIPRALNISAFSRDLLQGRSVGFSVCAGFSNFFREQAARFIFRVLVSLSVSSVEPELVMDVEPTVCLSPADVEVVWVAPKKKPRAPSHVWTDEETGVFLSLMQGNETTIGYFNRMKLKRCRGRWPERKSPGSWEERASAWQQSNSSLLRTASSPFFTMVIRDGWPAWPVSFDYAIVIHSTHSMLKNSIQSIEKLMNGPTAFS